MSEVNPEILIQNVRAAFAHGIFDRQTVDGKEGGYGAKFILDPKHPQLAAIEKLEEQIAEEKWGKKAKDTLTRIRAKDQGLIHDGSTQRSDGFDGMKFISANNDKRPTAYNKDRSPVTKDDGVIYSGCYLNVKVRAWAQDNNFGQRINWELQGVQFVRDGDSFGGGGKPAEADDFPDLDASGGEDADPLFG
jgi:hypothetical protein